MLEIDSLEVTDTRKETPKEADYVITIALFGSDFSEFYDVSSANATMILSIDTKNNKIKLSSLMRDIYLDLPDGNKVNLNYTILYGGPSSILKAINYNFNLKIDKFVQVDLKRLPKIIDSLGGVEMEITQDELKYINSYIDNIDKNNDTKTQHITTAGKQLLSGTQSSAYCRIRYTEGRDFRRTERQRDALEALFVKFKDISLTEIISISNKALGMGLSNIEQGRFPSDGNIISAVFTDMYHTNIDIEGTTKELHKFLFSIE
jgi:polyisoprenyl-teichoic acid--peptidoglycan teichoic acid transferase